MVVIAALMLPALPASCLCAAATAAPVAHAGCHGGAEAPRAPARGHGRDCGRCQVAVASAPGQQTLSPPPAASRMLAVAEFVTPSGLPAAHPDWAPQRATRPPPRTILLEKHVLLL